MTEVLHLPRQHDGQSFYQSSALHHSTPSSSSLFLDTSSRSASPKPKSAPHAEHQERLSTPTPDSSVPPSSASSFSTISSVTSDASYRPHDEYSLNSGLALDTDIDFPNYDDGSYASQNESSNSTSSSPAVCEESSVTDTSISDSPLPTPTVSDDSAVKDPPSRQVDFLSHDWKEEDIWASWRHIVSQRKSVYGERSRLENASWRTWAKTKFDLRTVSPERLNWLKESDVTWLYGPLKSASSYPITQDASAPESQISKNNSFVNKKPILKKRSVSEVMLQNSISTSSLVKQATDRVQAQGRVSRRASLNGVVDSKLQSETPSRDQVDYFASRSNSNGSTPCETQEKRHIRFDERVEQCIAVDHKDPAADIDEESEEEDEDPVRQSSDSSSDDGIVMMKRKKRPSGTKKNKSEGSRSSSTSGRKIIETLPSTTLKYRTDSPDITEEAHHHTFGSSWGGGKLSPSPSQETLRPSHPSTNFLLPGEEDEEEDIDSDSSWSFGASNPKSSLGASAGAPSRRDATPAPRARTPGPSDYEMEGMRRTSSGMFMPVDDDEDDIVAAGLFGRVSETINTARDIAHVIWNVGWRSG